MAITLCFQLFSACCTNEVGEVPLQSTQSPRKKQTICAPQLTQKWKWPLRFAFIYVQPRYTALQMKNNKRSAIQSPGKILVYKHREAFVLLGIDTLSCQQKEMGHKRGQR